MMRMFMVKISRVLLISPFVIVYFLTNCWAGNLSIIEKRLKELDKLNKQAIKQVVKIPENGTIKATLNIPAGNNIEQITVKKLLINNAKESLPFTIQISASTKHNRILDVARKLRKANIPAFVSTSFQHKGTSWWRIFVGAFPTKILAKKFSKKLEEQSLPKGFISHRAYALQVGKEVTEEDALLLEQELEAQDYLPYRTLGATDGLVRVLLGAFKTEQEAEAAMGILSKETAPVSIVLR